MKTIFIEGNIGAGKSTLLEMLKTRIPNSYFAAEPVERWQNFNGLNLLDLMYKDGEKYSMIFELYAMMTKIDRHTAVNGGVYDFGIFERSPYSAMQCFSKNMKNDGMMTSLEYDVLREFFIRFAPKYDGVVYIKTSPLVAFDRTAKRLRHEEASIPFSLFEKLHNLHEEWLATLDGVFVFDGDLKINDREGEISRLVNHLNTI